MKRFLLLFTIGSLCTCTPDSSLTTASRDEVLNFRETPGCNNFCDLEDISACLPDFSDCASLAGSRPFITTIGPPPLTFTGQKGNDPDIPFQIGFCTPPDTHPFIFNVKGGFDGSRAVERSPHLGRWQWLYFDLCTRPYILPSFDPFPFPQPFPYDLYPAGNEMWGDWTFVAANGDELIIHIIASFYPDCDNIDLYEMRGKWMVTGGTGRFESASGGGCVSGTGWGNFFDPEPEADPLWLLEGGIDF